jgi:hypothetical protein
MAEQYFGTDLKTRIEELKLRLRTNGDNPEVRAELAALEAAAQTGQKPKANGK